MISCLFLLCVHTSPQAFEYERLYGVCLDEFFASTETIFRTKAFQALNGKLREERTKWLIKHAAYSNGSPV